MLEVLSLERPKNIVKQWIQLLSNPTSIYLAILISLQITFVVGISLFVPFFVRYSLLPSSIQQEVPLNLVFLPCEEHLHGVCSFPSAQLDVKEMDIFSPSVYYQISVRLHFSEADTNFGIGLFQNEINLSDGNDKLIGRWRRTGLLKAPGIFTKLLWVCFFPLYFLGFFHDYHILEIPLVGEYFASPERVAHHLTYSLQDRFAQVDTAYLLINAKFGFIRNFLYYWPLSSFIILFLATAIGGLFIVTLFWGHKGYHAYTSSKGSQPESRRDSIDSQKTHSSTITTTTESVLTKDSVKEFFKNLENEFIPENVNEVPECPKLENFPGWNIKPIDQQLPSGLRNRKDKTYYT